MTGNTPDREHAIDSSVLNHGMGADRLYEVNRRRRTHHLRKCYIRQADRRRRRQSGRRGKVERRGRHRSSITHTAPPSPMSHRGSFSRHVPPHHPDPYLPLHAPHTHIVLQDLGELVHVAGGGAGQGPEQLRGYRLRAVARLFRSPAGLQSVPALRQVESSPARRQPGHGGGRDGEELRSLLDDPHSLAGVEVVRCGAEDKAGYVMATCAKLAGVLVHSCE